MAAPAALVTVELKKISGVDLVGIAAADRPYVLATLAGRALGRSRLIPAAAKDFDFAAEPEKWVIEMPIGSGQSYSLAVEIWDDKGDVAPARLLSISASIASPFTPGTRVFTSGGTTLEVEIKTQYMPPDAITAHVPRSPEGLSVPAVVIIPNVIVLEWNEIKGLYKPGFAPVGVKDPKRSEPSPGYASEDHKGRIFLNRDHASKYKRDTQFIEAAVKVNVRRGLLPSDAKVKWTLVDVDDPFDAPSEVHRQWASYIDKNDYDAAGVPTGMKGGDNEGVPDKSPNWEKVGPYALTVVSATEAKTDIVSGESKVTLHCPNIAGDTFVLKATIETAKKAVIFGIETGVITMWHRIDVEYIKMASALDIPINDVPPYFEPACAELNMVETTNVADKPFMAPDDNTLSAESSKFVEKKAKHIKDPGWFFLVSAMEPHPLPVIPGGNVYTGKVDLQEGGSGAGKAEFIEIDGDHPDSDYVEFTWGGQTVGFSANSTEVFTVGALTKTRIWLSPHDVQPEFTAGDGSHNHAYATRYYYFPRARREGATWTAGGYGIPTNVDAEISLPGAFYTSGISPGVNIGSKRYFGARTVMFTHHGAYYDRVNKTERASFKSRIVETVAHELVHAFGMPHKCAYYDYKTPRNKTCPMNYSPNWMIDDKKDLIVGSSRKIGKFLCGRHLKEVRRVHLEDNDGLKSLGW